MYITLENHFYKFPITLQYLGRLLLSIFEASSKFVNISSIPTQVKCTKNNRIGRQTAFIELMIYHSKEPTHKCKLIFLHSFIWYFVDGADFYQHVRFLHLFHRSNWASSWVSILEASQKSHLCHYALLIFKGASVSLKPSMCSCENHLLHLFL